MRLKTYCNNVYIKLRKTSRYGRQLDESTNVGNRSKQLVHVRIVDIDSFTSSMNIYVDLTWRLKTTAEQVFGKLDEFIIEKQIAKEEFFSNHRRGS